MECTNSIVVGIDFGTTYSGVAWALRDGGGDIEVISTWPGGGSRTTPKAPTSIVYKKNTIQWGYQTGDMDDTIQGVKLLLDRSHKPSYPPAVEARKLIKKQSTTPVHVAGDYIRQLVAHVKDTLDRRFGSGAKYMSLEYVLTVPAVWSDMAKSASIVAAEEAGIPAKHLTLVSEPEAAALHCLRSILPNTIEKGDVVLVCDAGGGTVDLISYYIKSTNPLRLEEAIQGTGGMCGSTSLDERFKEHLRSRFGRKFDNVPNASKHMAMKHWMEVIKPNFTGPMVHPQDKENSLDGDYFVPIPGISSKWTRRLGNDFYAISADTIKGIFDPVLQEVEDLVEHQMNSLARIGQTPKALLLVGGLGSSEYLFRRLQKRYSSVDILQPSNAWSAVVQGAVQYGLCGNRVEKRVARRNYGICITLPLGDKDPQGHETYWCELREMWRINNCMAWYIRKGDDVSEDKPIKMPWHRVHAVDRVESNPDCLLWTDTLYVCYDDSPPEKRTKREETFESCKMSTDVRSIPTELFEKRTTSKGKEYYEAHFEIHMTPKSASILFELVRDGKSYGAVYAKY